ncbi:hypothetical protein MA16_Dca012765 [Dendrobium catenatum]|uniref:Uncharacterized protein n=1 Tax=Dendrobium catenatum TaxID=906689 RepID=A0A2I0V7Q6_9ASPA|nr:hypothetical protein MA16_Dca012765 [Dendrobium catenatum]
MARVNKINVAGRGGFTRRCASLVREQRARIYILRRCATMLLCCGGFASFWAWLACFKKASYLQFCMVGLSAFSPFREWRVEWVYGLQMPMFFVTLE